MLTILCLSFIVTFFSNPLKLLFPFHFACFHFYLLLRFQHFLCHFMLFLVLPSFLWFYYFFFHFFPELCQLPAFVFLSHARVCASVLYFHFMAVIALPQFFFSFSYIILAQTLQLFFFFFSITHFLMQGCFSWARTFQNIYIRRRASVLLRVTWNFEFELICPLFLSNQQDYAALGFFNIQSVCPPQLPQSHDFLLDNGLLFFPSLSK